MPTGVFNSSGSSQPSTELLLFVLGGSLVALLTRMPMHLHNMLMSFHIFCQSQCSQQEGSFNIMMPLMESLPRCDSSQAPHYLQLTAEQGCSLLGQFFAPASEVQGVHSCCNKEPATLTQKVNQELPMGCIKCIFPDMCCMLHMFICISISLPISPSIPPVCMQSFKHFPATQPLQSLKSTKDPGINLNIILLYLLEMSFRHISHGGKSIICPGCTAEGGGASDTAKAVHQLSQLSC